MNMTMVKIIFRKCVQNSQDLGTDQDHMVSQVFFDVEVDGTRQVDLCADIKQSVGSAYETEPLEVSRPKGLRGPLNYAVFREKTEQYYLESFGTKGNAVNFPAKEKHIRLTMRNNTVIRTWEVEFAASETEAGW
jgi:hypothetical protein